MNTLLLASLSDGAKKGLMFGLLAVVLVGMIVFSFISNKKNKKNQATLNSQIKVGARIRTAAGMLGYITQVNVDNTIIVNCGTEEAPNFVCMVSQAVAEVLVPAPKTPEEIAAEKEAEELIEAKKNAKENKEVKEEIKEENNAESAAVVAPVEEIVVEEEIVEIADEPAKEEVVEEKKEEAVKAEEKKEAPAAKKSTATKKSTAKKPTETK